MLLAADIGNTNITLGLFENNNLIDTRRLNSRGADIRFEYEKLLIKLSSQYNIDCCVISSVCDEVLPIFKIAVQDILGIMPIVLNYKSFSGMKVLSEHPETAGIDRLANAYQAKMKYGAPSVVVDVGSAITFDVISEDGNFAGGMIMPGLNMELKSLANETSKLPLIEPKEIRMLVGNTTEDCILSGVILGTACAIDGLIRRLKSELGENTKVILTGGHCELIKKYLETKIEIDKNLTLNGIVTAYKTLNQ